MMEGYGVYIWEHGTIYRGQWQNSMMHGCGVKLTKQPNGQILAEEGEFVNDEWAGNVMGCSISEARRAAAQADTAGQMAAVFELSQPLPAKNEGGPPKRVLPKLHTTTPANQNPLEFVQGMLDKLPKIKLPIKW